MFLTIFLLEKILPAVLILLLTLILIYSIFRNAKDFTFKDKIENLKTGVEILAFLYAGLYFIYQFVTGLSVINMDLGIVTQRQRFNDVTDYMKVVISLKKGNVNSLYIHQIQGQIIIEGDSSELIFDGYKRLCYKGSGETTLFDKWKIDNKEKYQLATNESTQFSTFVLVPANKACRIEVAVLGGSKEFQYAESQWRISDVSLPGSDCVLPKKE